MYFDRMITSFELAEFTEYIPVNYHSQITAGELMARAVYSDRDHEDLVGVTVTGDHAGWLEIVWLSLKDKEQPLSRAAKLLRYCINKARLSGRYLGAFLEIHRDEETGIHRDILILAGMEIKDTENNNYEFSLSDIVNSGSLELPGNRVSCVPVAEADEGLLDWIETVMNEDERPIPTPYEMDWEGCERDLSMICLSGDTPAGLLYFVKESDYLVLELAYTRTALALPAMLKEAIRAAGSKYDKDQKVLVPIVGKGTGEIINKMVPGAKRGRITEAVCWFERPIMPPAMEVVINRAVKQEG